MGNASGNLWGNPVFWVIIVNVLSFIADFFLESMPKLQARFFELPRPVQRAAVIFVSGPPIVLAFLPQPRFQSLSTIAITVGIIFIAVAAIFEILAFRQIGFVPSLIPGENKKKVIDTGIYGLIRHPIYSGVILLSLGLSLIFTAIYALMYVPVVTLLFGIITVIEEKVLVKDYGEEYREYQKKTRWRLIPFLF